MVSDIKLLDGDQVLVEGADLVVDRVQPAGQQPSSVSLNLKNPTGFWHISGPRTYETGNPLCIFWNDNSKWSSAYLTINTAGNVGIGTPDPGNKLDITGRLRVRQANDTAGIWFYQTKPAKNQAFVGMSTDTQVGFWGNTGAGWGFVMDTTTGNVGIGTGQATPTSKLQVNGSLMASSIRVDNNNSGSSNSRASRNIDISDDRIALQAFNGDPTSGTSSLTITSQTILVKTVSKYLSVEKVPGGFLSGGIGEMKETEHILDLVEEVKKLRTEVDSLNAKVKALEANQKK